MPTKEEIIAYLEELLESLDGNGIIYQDEVLVHKWLEACGDFSVLRGMFGASMPEVEL